MDSKGVPYRYTAKANSSEIELLLEKDRVILKAWKGNDALCTVSNPVPRASQITIHSSGNLKSESLMNIIIFFEIID